MGPASKRLKRRHVEPKEEESGQEEVVSSGAEQEEEDEALLSGDDSEGGLDFRGDSESDMQEDSDHDDDDDGEEEEDDERVKQSEGSGGRRLNASRGGAEMEELDKEYQDLRQQEQALLSNMKRQKDEDIIKGQAIKNQKALWNRNLEFRFLLQKAFSNSNKLPQEPLRSQFCGYDKTIEKAYSDLILSSEQTLNSLLELQEALVEKNASIPQDKYDVSNKLEDGIGDKWFQMQRMQCRIAPFRNSSIDKWQRKTQVTSGAAAFKGKLHAFNQNVSEQVSAYMRDPSRMIGRMQLKRSAVGVLGETGNVEAGNVDADPDLIDDSEFYQQLLKEFFESYDLTSEPAFYSLNKFQTKKRKTVDRRASKSRKIRYNVHEKIVNFMAPMPMVLPPMAPKLFDNLFGLRKKESASAL